MVPSEILSLVANFIKVFVLICRIATHRVLLIQFNLIEIQLYNFLCRFGELLLTGYFPVSALQGR